MDACRVLAHLLLDRRHRSRAYRQPHSGVGSSRGRLYRSEPAIHALDQDLVQRPLNNVTRPAVYALDQDLVQRPLNNVTRPAVHALDQDLVQRPLNNVTRPAVHALDHDVTRPAVHALDHDVTRPAVHTLDHDVTRPAVHALDHDVTRPGLLGSVDSDVPPLPTSRPPAPPTHPPPPVPPHGQLIPQPPQQPLPPVPGHRQEENMYQQEFLPQAPGTCTLPRRGIVREDPNGRFRSPSNPPPASRQPPPYSRHQPPDPIRRPRGSYQHLPPPKIDAKEPRDPRESRERDMRELHGGRETREKDPRDIRNSRNLENLRDTDFREMRDPRERDARDQWEGRDFRGSHDSRTQQEPKDVRDTTHFREIRETWERRNSGVPRDQPHEDHLSSSSLHRPNYESWVPKNNRWSTREVDSGFDSLNSPAMEAGPRSLDSPAGRNGRLVAAPGVNPGEVSYSQSTEDLLNASRTSPVSVSSATSSVSSSPAQYPTIRPAKQPCVTGALHTSLHTHPSPHSSPHPGRGSPHGPPHHHSPSAGPPRPVSPEGALLSDSVYPQHDTQPRYAEIPDVTEPRKSEVRLNHRLSRDLRDIRDVCDMRDSRELRETKRDITDSREPRNMRNSSEPRSNKDLRHSREVRDTSLPRDFRDNHDSRAYMEVREERLARDGESRGFRELSVDIEDHDLLESRQERNKGRWDSRLYTGERPDGAKEVRFTSDPSDGLRVRDIPVLDRRDRDADGADGLQVTEERRASSQPRDAGIQQQESRRGDGCTSSPSVSWMEWTQQLQAYVAWVNSQLRKRGRPLITDLRRDLQSGVVFADLIEIISGESVAGIAREVETGAQQVMRDNLERILQFMAAKRIRMTHITSKEVVEGNLKSIMRIILALAAHYKPQSVKSASPPQQETSAATRILPHPATHDVGVGPDAPSAAPPDNTPNLSANRRALVTGGGGDDPGGVLGLRRHPSMTAPATTMDSSPVYENLPRRVAPSRWAYDSLRASHKFQWSGPPGARRCSAQPSGANKTNLDESSDDQLNTSFNTTLNTSMDGDAEASSPRKDTSGTRNSTRPAALNFWQDLTGRREAANSPASTPPPPPPPPSSQPPPDDPDNPFRYHTIHRMSGRRKLPQIPGAAGPSSRVTTPQDGPDSPRGPGESALDRSDERPGGDSSAGDEGSREPEGRSQNSSPATSLVRGPTLDQWHREKTSLDPWEHEDLKAVMRDLNNTKDQLLALQHLEVSPCSRAARGGPRPGDLVQAATPSVQQELLHLSLVRQALEAEKMELTRLLEQREGIITELRKQMHQRDKTIQAQRAQFEDVLRNVQNGKRVAGRGESPAGRGGVSSATKEDLQLVRDAIVSLRNNFRETDPNQHTLDTLEQAIAILIERGSGGGGSGGSSGGGGSVGGSPDKTARPVDKRLPLNGVVEVSTKVIYFTERTVTPFMSTISKRLGEIRLRDFKNMFDRPGLFRFHFKSYDPEYGLVKEEIVNEDDILPGVDGKIIAWVEEDVD